ncbi:MAG: hypothetical protein HIU83_12255 [Proteobacteria bacterium]|nr:hypothetical protein [Pseudomonadota bacterium]
MKRVMWSIQAVIFYLCTLAFSLLPQRLVRPVGHLIGTLGFALIPKRRHIAITNIRQSLPAMTKQPDWDFSTAAPEKITRLMFCHLGISLVETCRLYHGRGEEVLQNIEVRGEEYLEARARGKGVVVLTGHCGNWELAALALARHFNSPMAVVARRQNSPYLNSMVEKMRLRYGNLIIYKDNAFRGMIKRAFFASGDHATVGCQLQSHLF